MHFAVISVELSLTFLNHSRKLLKNSCWRGVNKAEVKTCQGRGAVGAVTMGGWTEVEGEFMIFFNYDFFQISLLYISISYGQHALKIPLHFSTDSE